MPIYTYQCLSCGNFELSQPMSKVKDKTKCPECGKSSARNILADAATVCALGVNGPQTVGGIADKNADKLSEDNKEALRKKHTEYRREGPDKALPEGISRIEKPEVRTRWT